MDDFKTSMVYFSKHTVDTTRYVQSVLESVEVNKDQTEQSISELPHLNNDFCFGNNSEETTLNKNENYFDNTRIALIENPNTPAGELLKWYF